MTVGKIFKVLIIVVACVIIGALVLNVLLPNTATALVNSTEDMIFKATGMSFDFNGDTDVGAANANNTYGANITTGGTASEQAAGVEGFN